MGKVKMGDISIENSMVGDFVKFKMFKQKYTIRCRNERFIVCTKPYNLKKTTLYTIIDLEKQIRGTDNFHGLGYESPEMCVESFKLFLEQSGCIGRNQVSLDIEKVWR